MGNLGLDSSYSKPPARYWVWGAGLMIWIWLASKAISFFSTGALPGNDDLLRLQQVRDLLTGQNWFNTDQTRFLTPEGGDIHWSRLPDLYLASVIWILKPVLGVELAERVAAASWPLVLLVGALSALVVIMRRAGFSTSAQVFGLLCFGVSGAIYNFWPGRIDHHNLVVVLTLIGLAAALAKVASFKSGAIAGLCCAVILSVALEGLPYVGGIILVIGLFWIVRGHNEAERLTGFGLALITSATLAYVLDAPGPVSQRMVCDAYGASHFAGFLVGGASLIGLAVFGGIVQHWRARLGLGVLVGGLTLAVFVLVNPSCLGDPYAGVSDEVVQAWLGAVGEARSILRVWAEEPATAVLHYGFMIAGMLGLGVAVWQAEREVRLERLGILIMALIAGLTMMWQLRGITFAHVFASIGGGYVIGATLTRWFDKRGAGPILGVAIAALIFSPIGWSMLSVPFKPAPKASATEKPYRSLCRDPVAYRTLPQTRPMRIFSSIDLGMPILSATDHEVYAGPYHRNVEGLEQVTSVFLGSSNEARTRLTEMGATHVLYCQGLAETSRYARLEPKSFGADLQRGDLPDWLVSDDGKTETDGEVRLYRISVSRP